MIINRIYVLLKAVVWWNSCYGAQQLMLDASYDVGVGGRQVKTICENTYKANRLYFSSTPMKFCLKIYVPAKSVRFYDVPISVQCNQPDSRNTVVRNQYWGSWSIMIYNIPGSLKAGMWISIQRWMKNHILCGTGFCNLNITYVAKVLAFHTDSINLWSCGFIKTESGGVTL